MSPPDIDPKEQLSLARTAAVSFCRRHGYSDCEIALIEGDPVLGPVTFERYGTPITAFRWISAGRGSTFVQVEIGTRVAVRGARSDFELPLWIYTPS